jgi:parvulin-like peptidyl-prolyl isomerase
LSAVTRTPARLVALAATALLATACSTFSDDNLAARVEDVEFSRDDFAATARGLMERSGSTTEGSGSADFDHVDRKTAGDVIASFVYTELLRNDLEQFDQSITLNYESTDAPLDAMQSRISLVSEPWLALTAEQLIDQGVIDFYARGPITTNIACAQHILTATRAEAIAARERVEAGEAFSDVAAEVSTDTGSGANGGRLGCYPTTDFLTKFVPDFSAAAVAGTVGKMTQPVKTEFGYHVIRLIPLDEIPLDELPVQMLQSLRLRSLAERFDVMVDPQLGTWGIDGLVPLG